MKNVAIILAGGKGKRMNAPVSKQFIEIDEKPVIYYTLKKFENCVDIDEIVLVLPKDEIDYFNKNIQSKYNFNISKIVEGGSERSDSVYNALKELKNTNIVLIHDGARAFVSEDIIKNGIKNAKEFGAAAPGVTPKDTIKVKDNLSFSKDTPIRDTLIAIQTPQCFKFSLIRDCHEKIRKENVVVTDDTMVVERYGNKVYLYEGDYKNIKLTTEEDLILAKEFVKYQNES
ncbi:2-C-methyl-D-erythritol 4-phosphate cytidylyltransferase [uncultured Clostridium sp.]|jgi:2-C-methyl-D-erythritol 4-phosphate cytidylyltransferase|uniref:2-C-methyl-D-erythritol 4-phosphate cytidylyltransferase n=1 Tax=uncultured Clostridium sp. TaxID=59620 RepID=UPI00260FFEDF|nr:2-C-methyl-D-erythritol 4-phosphate cytidylyltransferase [uncultured Clostridium sp.]